MQKILAYYLACGEDKYFQEVKYSIMSLRRIGCYTGEICVVTDNPEQFKEFKDLTVYDMRGKIPPKKASVDAGVYFQNCKPFIRTFLKADAYDFIIYMDGDTLIVSPRFTNLLYSMSAVGGFWVQQNYWGMVNPESENPSMGGGLNPEDFIKCQNLSVCSGIVGMGHGSYQYFEHWKSLCERDDMSSDDQGSLHLVAAYVNGGRINYLPQTDVWFPTNRIRTPSIYHFTHEGKKEQAYMTKLLFP